MAVNEMGMQNFSQIDDTSVGLLYSSRSRDESNMLPPLDNKSSAYNSKMHDYSNFLHSKPFDTSTIIVDNSRNSKLFNKRHPSVNVDSIQSRNKLNQG